MPRRRELAARRFTIPTFHAHLRVLDADCRPEIQHRLCRMLKRPGKFEIGSFVNIKL